MKEKNKLSKGREIKYKEHKMQSYMKPGSGLAPDTARKIFSLRSRDLQIRGNFPNSHEDLSCVMPLCQERETQEHLWSCSFLAPENVIVQQDLQYYNIFCENVRKQGFNWGTKTAETVHLNWGGDVQVFTLWSGKEQGERNNQNDWKIKHNLHKYEIIFFFLMCLLCAP